MPKYRSNKAFTRFLRQIVQVFQALLTGISTWFWRAFLGRSRRRQQQAGFVLPTIVLVLLVVGLVVTSIIFRTISRSSQVIGERQQQVIYNLATPAIDRAKAKIEYMFTKDPFYTGGVPPETYLADMMMRTQAYDLPSETRLQVGSNNLSGTNSVTGKSRIANAWAYDYKDPKTGKTYTIAYSILMYTQGQASSNSTVGVVPGINNVSDTRDLSKAAALVVRTGPASTAQVTGACQIQGGFAVEQGWFKDVSSSSLVRKNFQVNAVVIDQNKTVNQPAATLEFEQDRKVDRGNKWAAWFRNDLEIYPGPQFNWNGAMHTEGSLIMSNTAGLGGFRAYLISSPKSCLYGSDGIEASEISVNQQPADSTTTPPYPGFQGQIVSGSMASNSFVNSVTIDRAPGSSTTLTPGNDSVLDSGATPGNLTPTDLSLDPLQIFTQDQSLARNSQDPSNQKNRDTVNWSNSNPLATGDSPHLPRVVNNAEPKPLLDDTYRADDRYGPKPPPTGFTVGQAITDPSQISLTPPTANPEQLGKDGYWERRAYKEGLRLIVGQRLELGTPLPVPTPLPAYLSSRPHEALQRRALKDNVAAVQSTAIYHANSSNPNFPLACLATTVHPGTSDTLKRSATFQPVGAASQLLYSDFFTGRGTNGWEYAAPSPSGFPNASLRSALQNLANFAGDPVGAYPATQDTSASPTPVVHPYPELTKWGDFSNLRRALTNLNSSSFASLSIADKSYIQTAACTLGMLAYNVRSLQQYSYSDPAVPALNTELGDSAYNLPPQNLPLQTIQVLENKYGINSSNSDPVKANWPLLARLIYLREQLIWDLLKPGAAKPACGLSGNFTKLCPQAQQYSALYYIFPPAPHPEDRPPDQYITTVNLTPYQAITATDLDTIALQPQTVANIATWQTKPVQVTSPSPAAPNDTQLGLIKVNNNTYQVPFKDTAFFNGREMMNTRALSVDLKMLRTNTSSVTNDTWLPGGGIVYAFREDAVREDAIARPALGTWAAYTTAWSNNVNSGPPSPSRMNAAPGSQQDPPVNSTNGVSPKPIDYYPDPDRRPYGFRLRNGSDLTRTGASNSSSAGGLSFISDNPVYVQGDFNLHQPPGSAPGNTTQIEEFDDILLQNTPASNFPNVFYNRQSLNPNFARPALDSWRPSEILGDAVTILSSSFCDGSVEDGFLTAGNPHNYPASDSPTNLPSVTATDTKYGCAANAYTSYLNQNRPKDPDPAANTPIVWQRENPVDQQSSPIQINENGSPIIATGPAIYKDSNNAYSGSYYDFTARKDPFMSVASPTRLNAVIVSGIVPSRAGQAYGGLHNFPRFLETWAPGPAAGTPVDLFLSGALFQLNFSSYATGQFQQDDWEPSQSVSLPLNTPNSSFYKAPNRRWGYDVGLQYQPAAPVSRRFAIPSSTRSEFYKDLAIDDPYIINLRCATRQDNSSKVDPNASCT